MLGNQLTHGTLKAKILTNAGTATAAGLVPGARVVTRVIQTPYSRGSVLQVES